MRKDVSWQVVKIEDFADVRGGNAFSHKYQGNISGKYPFFKVSDMNIPGNEMFMRTANNWIDDEVLELIKAKLFSPFTIIFPKVGAAVYTNKKRLLLYDSLVDNNVMGVSIKEGSKCVAEFLYYWFESIDITDLSNPGPLPSITGQAVKNINISLPSIIEQQAIVRALRAVQEGKEARRRELALERERKAALMDYLFTHGTRNEQRKQTEIGEIPQSWRVGKLGKHCHKPQYGYTASATTEPVGPKFLRITDIQEDKVDWRNVPYCICNDKVIKTYELEQRDIVIARIGATTGKTYLVKECPGAIFASYLIRIRAKKEDLLPEIIFFYSQTEAYWSQINQEKGGRLKGGVNIPILQNLTIPLPTIPEQEIIARILNCCDAKIAALEQEAVLLEELFRAMLEELMSGRLSALSLVEGAP